MAPHLSPSEQDVARQLNFQKKTTTDILKAINRSAAHRRQPLSVDSVRRFLRGKTHRQGGEERRGRKRVLGLRAVKALNKTRKALVKRANGEHEVHWQDVIKKTRVKQVHRSTAKRAFAREGVDVQWRQPREKPSRGPEHIKERLDVCRVWKDKPNSFLQKMDMIIDNKRWDFPTTDKARTYVRRLKVRGHLRTVKEGVKPGFADPTARRTASTLLLSVSAPGSPTTRSFSGRTCRRSGMATQQQLSSEGQR